MWGVQRCLLPSHLEKRDSPVPHEPLPITLYNEHHVHGDSQITWFHFQSFIKNRTACRLLTFPTRLLAEFNEGSWM